MQQAALFRRERQFVASGGWGVMCFWVLSAIICVICERIGRSHIRKEQGKSKERARNEQGINEHVSSQLCCINMNSIVFTMRQLSFVCEIMQLAAFPLRNLRDLREKRPFTCKERARKERGYSLTALLYKHELHCLHYEVAVFCLRNNGGCCILSE